MKEQFLNVSIKDTDLLLMFTGQTNPSIGEIFEMKGFGTFRITDKKYVYIGAGIDWIETVAEKISDAVEHESVYNNFDALQSEFRDMIKVALIDESPIDFHRNRLWEKYLELTNYRHYIEFRDTDPSKKDEWIDKYQKENIK